MFGATKQKGATSWIWKAEGNQLIEVYLKEHTKWGTKIYVTGFALARKIEQNMERMMEVHNNGLNV